VFLFGAHFADNESARVWVAGLDFFETKVLSKVADLTFVLVADGDKGIAAAVAGITQLKLYNDEVHMTKHLAKRKLDVKRFLDAVRAKNETNFLRAFQKMNAKTKTYLTSRGEPESLYPFMMKQVNGLDMFGCVDDGRRPSAARSSPPPPPPTARRRRTARR